MSRAQGSEGGTASKLAPEAGVAVDADQGPRVGALAAPGLHIVATPIGNMGDLSPRARAVLAGVGRILCEDTRVSGRMLRHLGITTRLLPYHEHNAAKIRPKLIAELEAGAALALISDAGTPAIADPGFKLVRAAHEAGVKVHAVPGPSAVIAALSISGLPSDRFFFQGFLPSKPQARRQALAELAGVPATLVIYESPNRLAASLADCAEILGPRPAAVAREITKLHEELRRGDLVALAGEQAAMPTPRGEIVLVIGPPAKEAAALDDAAIDAALDEALATMGPSQAAAHVSAGTGLPRRELYRRALGRRGM